MSYYLGLKEKLYSKELFIVSTALVCLCLLSLPTSPVLSKRHNHSLRKDITNRRQKTISHQQQISGHNNSNSSGPGKGERDATAEAVRHLALALAQDGGGNSSNLRALVISGAHPVGSLGQNVTGSKRRHAADRSFLTPVMANARQRSFDSFAGERLFLTLGPKPLLHGLCLINCPPPQTTSHLLLFTRPGTGFDPDVSLSRDFSPEQLRQTPFVAQKETVIIVHGWQGNGLRQQAWARGIKDLILAHRNGANVMYVDWRHHSRTADYIWATKHMSEVVSDIEATLMRLKEAFPNFRPQDVHVMGHSLGSHIAGLLGQRLGGELSQVTALDPAGFMLDAAPGEKKITRDDAKYIVALHTDGKMLGTSMNLADRDVHLNGGYQQPGCRGPDMMHDVCSHMMVVRLAATFMGKCMLVAYKCDNYAKFERGECGFCFPDNAGGGNATADLSCVAVGGPWQYDRDFEAPMRPRNLISKRTAMAPMSWTKQEVALETNYYVTTHADPPFCAFTYQVVVKFSKDAAWSKVRGFVLKLRAPRKGISEGITAIVEHRVQDSRTLPVFNVTQVATGSGSGTVEGQAEIGAIEGPNLFTGLGLVYHTNVAYRSMPIRFEEALIELEPGELLAGQSSAELQKLPPPQVFVNYMSHAQIDLRAKFSGPLSSVRVAVGAAGSVNRARATGSKQQQTVQPPPVAGRLGLLMKVLQTNAMGRSGLQLDKESTGNSSSSPATSGSEKSKKGPVKLKSHIRGIPKRKLKSTTTTTTTEPPQSETEQKEEEDEIESEAA